jgi:hypothetical protein
MTLSILAQTNFFSPLISHYGGEAKETFLAPAIRGEKIGALARPSPPADPTFPARCTAPRPTTATSGW